MRGRHPDDDVLADLAADVLPVSQARVVEAHVMECEHCSLLLSDAERIRGLLLSGDPGPMPADVWARIEAALAAAAPGSAAGPTPVAPATPATPAVVTPFPPALPPAAARPAWQDDDADDADPLDTPDHWGGERAASARPGAPATVRRLSSSRRDAREGGRRRPRWGLAVVAAAAVAVAVTAGTLRLTSGGSSSAVAGTAALGQSSGESSASAGAAGGAPTAVYERTGTKYTAAGLVKQAGALAAAVQLPAVVTRGTRSSAANGAGTPVAGASGGSGAPAAVPPAATLPDPTATDIANPAQLAGCLRALKASPDRVVAVDLATYDEREAAVIVLTAVGGGYEVFVVERTCSSADDRTLAYQALKG